MFSSRLISIKFLSIKVQWAWKTRKIVSLVTKQAKRPPSVMCFVYRCCHTYSFRWSRSNLVASLYVKLTTILGLDPPWTVFRLFFVTNLLSMRRAYSSVTSTSSGTSRFHLLIQLSIQLLMKLSSLFNSKSWGVFDVELQMPYFTAIFRVPMSEPYIWHTSIWQIFLSFLFLSTVLLSLLSLSVLFKKIQNITHKKPPKLL